MIYIIQHTEYSCSVPQTQLRYGTTNKDEAIAYLKNSCNFRNPAEYTEYYDLYEVNGTELEIIMSKDNEELFDDRL